MAGHVASSIADVVRKNLQHRVDIKLMLRLLIRRSAMSKKWDRIASAQFTALDEDIQQAWADLHDKVAAR
jgi:hypothetical protein